jgi:hypothetical protein
MPRPKSWISCVSAIVEHLKSGDAESYGTAQVRELFRVSATQAKEILSVAGATARPGFPLTISRDNLLAYVENSPEAAEAIRETARRRKLAESLAVANEEQRLRRIPIHTQAGDEWTLLRELTGCVRIQPPAGASLGELAILFIDAEDLLRKLYRLSKAIGAEEDAFRKITAPAERKAG